MNRLITIIMLFCLMQSSMINTSADDVKIPLIYCSDLFHPHDDPDDHFDLASIFAIPEIDIKAIILDQGMKQDKQPGRIPVGQLNHLTGRNVPCAIGLSQKLEHPADQRLDEADKYQQAVLLILETLEQSQVPVTIIAVGSLRDVAVAYNRKPELFRKKVSRIFNFIGDAQGAFQEYNVGLDPNAYKCLMNAGLPLYWVPCFDGGLWHNDDGKASYWKASHAELLQDASAPVLNYFIYALLHKDESDPIAFLHKDALDNEKQKVLSGNRNLWCTAVFAYIANRKYVIREGDWISVPADKVRSDDQVWEIFTFSPVKVHVDDAGKESYKDVPDSCTIKRFQIIDMETYAQAMTSVTRELIGELSNNK